MKLLFSCILGLAASRASANTWFKAGATNAMCVGVVDTDAVADLAQCTNVETCTTVMYGPCAGDTTASTTYLKSKAVGLAFVDLAKYLDCANPLACADMKVVPADETKGYRDMDHKDLGGGSSYKFTMSGAVFGDMATMGGYVGTASYVNTGTAAIATQYVPVYVANAQSTTAETRGGSTQGAPKGPYEVCIAPFKADAAGKCGAARTFPTGTYKFSIFGYTSGANYAEISTVPRPAGFPAVITHLGARFSLSAEGFTVDAVTVNDGKTVAQAKGQDVTKLVIVSGDNEVTIDFPLKYNYGTLGIAVAPGEPEWDKEKHGAPLGTKDVKIRVSMGPGTQELYLDYLFDNSDFPTENMWFMYDPTATTAPKKKVSPLSPAASIQLSASVAVGALAAVALN